MGIPQEGIQGIPASSVLFSDKRHTGSHPGDFLFCPASSALQGPLKVVVESEQPKAVFSLLASYFYCLPLLSLNYYCQLRKKMHNTRAVS